MKRFILALAILAGCGAEDGCNTFGKQFGFGPSFKHRVAVPVLLPSSSGGGFITGNNFLCGQPDHLEGDTRITAEFSFRAIGAGELCSAQAAQPFWDVHSSAANALFRMTCNDDGAGAGNEFRIQVFNGTGAVNCTTTDLELQRGDGWIRLLTDMNVGAGTVTLYALSPSIGIRQITVGCDAALPAAFDSTSVTCELEIQPGSGVSYGTGAGIDDVVIWDNIGPASLQQVRDYWGEAVGHEGEPIDPRLAPWGAASNWISFGDHPADTLAFAKDIIGTNNCVGTMDGFSTTHLPVRSRLNTELAPVLSRTFTISAGTQDIIDTSNGLTAQYYSINAIGPLRYGRNRLRVIYSNGGAHVNVNHRIHYGNSLNNGMDWFWGLGAVAASNYPWSSESESVVEPSQAPSTTNIEGGNRGPQVMPILSDYDSQQGGALLLFNTTYTVNPTVRPGGGLLSDLHSDTLTYTEDRDGGANSVNFFPTANGNSVRNAIGGAGIELLNGDALWTTYGHDTGSGCINGGNQIRLWRSTGPHDQDESWAAASVLIFDGCSAGAGGGFRPVEPSLTRWIQAPGDGSPNIHGRVFAIFKVDDTAPTGGATGTFTCIYADDYMTDPADASPDWRNCSDGSDATTTSVIWTRQDPGSNHNRLLQLANGTLAIAGRSQNAQYNILTTSVDRGATFTVQGAISAVSTVGSGAVGADVREVAPNRLSIVTSYERNDSAGRSKMIFGEVNTMNIPAGPLTWSNAGWCRYNDGGAGNEGHALFGYDVMEGLADGAIAFRYHTDDGAANKSIIARWGAAGGDQAFRIRHLSTEALAIDMGAHHCETAASAFATNTSYSIAVGLDGSGPTLTLYRDGSALACDQNVSGAVPSTWPASTARVRVGVAYDDTEDCIDCFVDEVVLYDGITFSAAARAAALIGADPRTVDVDGDSTADWPLAYYRCEGENSQVTLANGGAIAENWGWWPTWAMPLNLEVADLGVAP